MPRTRRRAEVLAQVRAALIAAGWRPGGVDPAGGPAAKI
jgi:hypothetical protein